MPHRPEIFERDFLDDFSDESLATDRDGRKVDLLDGQGSRQDRRRHRVGLLRNSANAAPLL